jgi:maltooligosyltrehalose trehalohydrolase
MPHPVIRSSASSIGTLGAREVESGVAFRVWAPRAATVDVHLLAPDDRIVPLDRDDDSYFTGQVDGLGPDVRYKYRLDGLREFPDPASRFQPEGVHGPSQVVSDEFAWTDRHWRGLPLADCVIYEVHVGTFTEAGTFDGAIERLPYLRDLGVTAVELMPVAQFPGARNWGYDGVYPFAVQASYGGPEGLKRLVDAAHATGLAVLLDVVYNHFGPEGNYLGQFAPYFTTRYTTPWGTAINFDDAESAHVRRFVLESALQWTTGFHMDGLRLDAVHTIFDASPRHILAEIAAEVHHHAGGRLVHVTAESDLNEARLVVPLPEGGHGLDAQWSDDFHHALHAALTGERGGYYEDFGSLDDVVRAYERGFVYTGQHSPHRGRPHGTASTGIPGERFIVFTQNHDQIGNRMNGERLPQLIGFEELKLAAAALLLAPYVPLLFMGQEYAERAPFLYFVSHSDEPLIQAVRDGRRAEFAAFAWQGEVPDPQADTTFLRSRLDPRLIDEPRHREMLEFHRGLLRLRRAVPALRALDRERCAVTGATAAGAVVLRRWQPGS